MTDTPLYDQTLSDVLQQARLEAERRLAEAERRVAAAEQRAAVLERQERVRRALTADQDGPAPADVPSVPSVAEVFQANPGVARFLDSLVGLP